MTEEQRKELEELILEFEQVVLLTERDASVDLIQWDAALYNFRRSNVEELQMRPFGSATRIQAVEGGQK